MPAWAWALIAFVVLFVFRRRFLLMVGGKRHRIEGHLVVDTATLLALILSVVLGWHALAGIPARVNQTNLCVDGNGKPVTNNIGCPDTYNGISSPPPEIDASRWGQTSTR
jgi:hypothetical protein